VEFVHTATLLHDDVVDQSDLRRGNRVAYRIWGAEPSVLSGDYLYSRAFNLLVEIGLLEILGSISSATTQMARGEVLQLLRSYSTSTSRKEYLEVIEGKTASLIAASCRSAAILAGFTGDTLTRIENYGMNLGMSFQIVDDLLDYASEGGVLGKAVGKDFMEGKVTLPVILLMEKLGREDRAMVADMFLQDEPRDDDFHSVLELMKVNGILEETRTVAEDFAARAADDLSSVNDGAAKGSLVNITRYVVSRKL
jgi:octaprenyl-diphosphate synthase